MPLKPAGVVNGFAAIMATAMLPDMSELKDSVIGEISDNIPVENGLLTRTASGNEIDHMGSIVATPDAHNAQRNRSQGFDSTGLFHWALADAANTLVGSAE